MLLLTLIELGGDPLRELLRYDRAAIASGEWWRLLTGNFVHLGWYHWMLNELGLLVLVLLCPDRLSMAVWTRRVVFLGVAMTLGLYYFVPDIRWYVGMSGAIHGLFVLGLVPQALKRDLIAAGCLAYLLGKIGWELFAGAPVSDEQALGGSVLVESHLYGTLAAFVYGVAFRSFWRPEVIVLPFRKRESAA
ncbi:MAG: rhombosortase [Gammaproteobacteria bacterium]|nr:rhombosortase [Gammaproteobacteria bacterium]